MCLILREFSHETGIRVDEWSALLEMPERFLKRPVILLHHICDAYRSASRDTREAVHEHVRILPIPLNELNAFLEVLRNIVSFSVVCW